jgi:uncharacterized protein (TIGR02284 family)
MKADQNQGGRVDCAVTSSIPLQETPMVTTVGTESSVDSLLEDLIQLDYDAAAAYQAAIDRLENARWRTTLADFKEDHVRHTRDLGDILSRLGRTPPHEGDAKSLLTQGKVVIAGLVGDEAILRAMRTNEADTNTAYERALEFKDLPSDAGPVLARNLHDERRHCAWILEQLNEA